MTRKEFLLSAVALPAAALDKPEDREREREIIRDLKDVIVKHGLSVAARTPAHLLARYLYKSLILFSQFSEMRDRT